MHPDASKHTHVLTLKRLRMQLFRSEVSKFIESFVQITKHAFDKC